MPAWQGSPQSAHINLQRETGSENVLRASAGRFNNRLLSCMFSRPCRHRAKLFLLQKEDIGMLKVVCHIIASRLRFTVHAWLACFNGFLGKIGFLSSPKRCLSMCLLNKTKRNSNLLLDLRKPNPNIKLLPKQWKNNSSCCVWGTEQLSYMYLNLATPQPVSGLILQSIVLMSSG